MKLKYKILLFVFALLLVGAELVLRFKYGFCNTVLFRKDPDYEYIAIPQKANRFGNVSYYNRYGQRNREISEKDSIIILGFGDSIMNGGVLTPQDSLATSLVTEYVSHKFGKEILMTNISAGSWGPDNCFAYLKKHGNFGAKVIFLQVSSHDAFDNMDFMEVVGKHQSYPEKQYKLALWELLDRYVIPRMKAKLKHKSKTNGNDDYEALRINKYKEGATFNTGFDGFKKYSDSTGIPLIVYLHADRAESARKSFNQDGVRIKRYCESNNIKLISELDFSYPPSSYRDKIHFSSSGQWQMFNAIKDQFDTFISGKP